MAETVAPDRELTVSLNPGRSRSPAVPMPLPIAEFESTKLTTLILLLRRHGELCSRQAERYVSWTKQQLDLLEKEFSRQAKTGKRDPRSTRVELELRIHVLSAVEPWTAPPRTGRLPTGQPSEEASEPLGTMSLRGTACSNSLVRPRLFESARGSPRRTRRRSGPRVITQLSGELDVGEPTARRSYSPRVTRRRVLARWPPRSARPRRLAVPSADLVGRREDPGVELGGGGSASRTEWRRLPIVSPGWDG